MRGRDWLHSHFGPGLPATLRITDWENMTKECGTNLCPMICRVRHDQTMERYLIKLSEPMRALSDGQRELDRLSMKTCNNSR